MNAKRIVIHYLRENGFDGLCMDGCGCGIGDFMPCGEFGSECIPAYVRMGREDEEFPGEPYYESTKPTT